ncbi:hypothetical protein [Turicimonas sp. TL08]
MNKVRYKAKSIELTDRHLKELEDLAKVPDSEIDYSDIPPLNPEDWKNASRGVFYHGVKTAGAPRLDATASCSKKDVERLEDAKVLSSKHEIPER